MNAARRSVGSTSMVAAKSSDVKAKLVIRRGFTLLELLLALLLSGMLLSAAFAAVHLSWKYRSAGAAQVEVAMVTRGVLEDLTVDLRSGVVPADDNSVRHQLDSITGLPNGAALMLAQMAHKKGAVEFEGLSEIRERVLQFETDETINPVHCYGESRFFVIQTANPNYRFAETENPSSAAAVSHVVWWWNSGQATRVPFRIQNDRLQYSTVSASNDMHGLVRIYRSMGADSVKSGQSTMLDETGAAWTRVLTSVESAEFRYSDGDAWVNSWNSHTSGRLPNAVELVVRRTQDPTAHRFVIRLPQVTSP